MGSKGTLLLNWREWWLRSNVAREQSFGFYSYRFISLHIFVWCHNSNQRHWKVFLVTFRAQLNQRNVNNLSASDVLKFFNGRIIDLIFFVYFYSARFYRFQTKTTSALFMLIQFKDNLKIVSKPFDRLISSFYRYWRSTINYNYFELTI